MSAYLKIANVDKMEEVTPQEKNVHEVNMMDNSCIFPTVDTFARDCSQTFNSNLTSNVIDQSDFSGSNPKTSIVHHLPQNNHIYKDSLNGDSKPAVMKINEADVQTTQGNVFGFEPVMSLSSEDNNIRNTQNCVIKDEVVPCSSTSCGQSGFTAVKYLSCDFHHQNQKNENYNKSSLVSSDEEMMKIVSSDNVSCNGMKKPHHNEVAETNFDDVKTVLLTNGDVTEEIKLGYTDNVVGQYETIGDRGEKCPSGESYDDHICGFTSLKNNKAAGSVKRKGGRPVKTITTWTSSDESLGETLHKLSSRLDSESHGTAVKVGKLSSPLDSESHGTAVKVGKLSSPLDSESHGTAVKVGTTENGKGDKKDKSTKTKLSVEQVYKSDEECEMESDSDIAKDLLRVKMLKCDKCGKHFLDNKKFKAHQRSHNKSHNTFGKWYSCEICGSTFNRREHWKRHELIHTGEFPFTCEICDRGFKRAEHVKRHQSVHTQDRPHQCTECDKRFTRAEHLRKHMKIHALEYTGGKPYPRSSASAATERTNMSTCK